MPSVVMPQARASKSACAPYVAAFAWLSAALLAAGCGPAAEVDGTIQVDRSANTGQEGFCRSTTCQPPAGYPREGGLCQPPDWADSDTCVKVKKATNAPLWWRNACVGYSLQKSGSVHVAYDVFSSSVQAAFKAWTTTACPSTLDRGVSHVSIDARGLDSVGCTSIGYDRHGPNQNLIVFRDELWPHESGGSSETVALTTVTFDTQTGEIFDADLELNSADHRIVVVDGTERDVDGAFDLQAVLTHEIGHFLGLAHSPRRSAEMFAYATPSEGGRRRALSLEDIAGICEIYPADGSRSVSALVDPTGKVRAAACDPTPRRGLDRTCGG